MAPTLAPDSARSAVATNPPPIDARPRHPERPAHPIHCGFFKIPRSKHNSVFSRRRRCSFARSLASSATSVSSAEAASRARRTQRPSNCSPTPVLGHARLFKAGKAHGSGLRQSVQWSNVITKRGLRIGSWSLEDGQHIPYRMKQKVWPESRDLNFLARSASENSSSIPLSESPLTCYPGYFRHR